MLRLAKRLLSNVADYTKMEQRTVRTPAACCAESEKLALVDEIDNIVSLGCSKILLNTKEEQLFDKDFQYELFE